MNILVFGATGPTGQYVIEQALAQGHRIGAVVRNPAKLKLADKVTVYKADVYNLQAVTEVVQSFKPDVVISCLGIHGTKPWKRTNLYSAATGIICAAMKSSGVTKRIIAISSWGTVNAPEVPFFMNLLRPLMAGFIYDMALMERILEESGLDYTIARPPGLTNGKLTGKVVVEPDKYSANSKFTITRADLATILLEVATKGLYVHKGVAVGNG